MIGPVLISVARQVLAWGPTLPADCPPSELQVLHHMLQTPSCCSPFFDCSCVTGCLALQLDARPS